MVLLTNSGSHSSRGEIFLRRKMERGRMSLLYVTCFFGGLFSWRLLYQNAKKHLPISLDAHKCKWSCPLWEKTQFHPGNSAGDLFGMTNL